MTTSAIAAYSESAAGWQRGPGRVYDHLAQAVVELAPVSLAGRSVLDVGAGTGAVTRAASAAGAALVVAIDAAWGMLRHEAARRPPAVVADARRLPFPAATFGAAIAAFSLNHLDDPAAGLAEMARVTERGSPLVVAAYGADDSHPVKAAVEAVLRARGWRPDDWYEQLRTGAAPLLATPERAAALAAAGGLDGRAELVHVELPDLSPDGLVEWRLGMAQHAPFLSRLPPEERAEVAAEARARLGSDAPTLVRSIVVLVAVTG